MKLYLSGPISGTDDYMERFQSAEKMLTEKGYAVINPAKVLSALPEDTTWNEYMAVGIAMLISADGIYLLRGWRQSKGACIEHVMAQSLDKQVMWELEKDG